MIRADHSDLFSLFFCLFVKDMPARLILELYLRRTDEGDLLLLQLCEASTDAYKSIFWRQIDDRTV
jgi:hypothetical protein